MQLPSADECDALIHERKLTAIVYFLDETFEELTYDVTTTVLEAVEQLAGIIKLQNYTTFTLYESRRVCCCCWPPAVKAVDIAISYALQHTWTLAHYTLLARPYCYPRICCWSSTGKVDGMQILNVLCCPCLSPAGL